MRDIKQYFVNGARIGRRIVDSEDNVEHMEEEQEDESVPMAGRKRKRVKIRISRTDSAERICDIIESKNDLVDKTPSPFTRANGDRKVSQSETPRSHVAGSSRKQDSKEVWN